MFIIGSGANGKSTLLNILSRLLGLDYSFSCSMNFFSERSIRSKSGPTPERAELIGRRFIQIDEIKAGEMLDANEFKLLTGSNSIPFRAMYGRSSVIINPTHKFIFSGNFLPELKNNNDGGLNISPISRTSYLHSYPAYTKGFLEVGNIRYISMYLQDPLLNL